MGIDDDVTGGGGDEDEVSSVGYGKTGAGDVEMDSS